MAGKWLPLTQLQDVRIKQLEMRKSEDIQIVFSIVKKCFFISVSLVSISMIDAASKTEIN